MDQNIDSLLERAERLAAMRDFAHARHALQAAQTLAPDDARAPLQLSYVESLDGRYRAAREAALRAHALRPRSEAQLHELVRRLRTFNEAEAIHDCLRRLPPLREVGIPLLLTFAAQLSYLNRQDDALALLDEARRGDPDYPPTLVSRGQVLTYLGRFDEAEADLMRCVRRAPELAAAWWALSRLRRQTPESNHVDAIRAQLSRPGRRADDVALLAFALHKEYDDLGEFEAAWHALELGCRAKRSTLRYSASETRALVDALVAAPTWSASHELAASDATPIFIVGMHRSGTTLLEQLLAAHPGVAALGELYDFTSCMREATDRHCRGVIDATVVERAVDVDFASVGRRYLDGVAWRLDGAAAFTDKLPTNFFHVGHICRALPRAKILHMRRDAVETCFSNLRELFSDANPHSYGQHELADYHGQYRRLMTHWHARFPGRILDIDYAALTADPEPVMRWVAAFCGLDFTPAMLDPRGSGRGVATASAVQVREGVSARAVPKWRRYAASLEPLRSALQT
ncbi:tetratricopeptide repeat-containing sulfotransferase family protein [Lysobacter arvi]|uniref:Sulfotransferase n=1 Tax=Lysobacter arvi TaxID=3038776 RepID=A0ABU1CBX0_9GAMM|nr:sulfotransferase [Lysobacter arvi]MDR0182651.1 sulfotransferase [Lysobacter arvi]